MIVLKKKYPTDYPTKRFGGAWLRRQISNQVHRTAPKSAPSIQSVIVSKPNELRGARRRGGVGGCVTCLVGRVRIEVRFVYTGYGAGARWWGCARRKWVWHMDADALRKPNGALRRKKATNVSREGQPHAFGVNMQRSAIWR